MPIVGRASFTPALVLALALAVLPSARPPTAARDQRCTRAVTVDGRLWCDHEVPATVAGLCGDAHLDAKRPIHGGDAIDRTLLCGVGARVGLRRMPPDDLEALDQPTDLNLADLTELEGLPGIGPKLAARIVAARPFTCVDALAEVRGIGPATLDRLRPRVIVRSAAE